VPCSWGRYFPWQDQPLLDSFAISFEVIISDREPLKMAILEQSGRIGKNSIVIVGEAKCRRSLDVNVTAVYGVRRAPFPQTSGAIVTMPCRNCR
jgi:hypothetical protein